MLNMIAAALAAAQPAASVPAPSQSADPHAQHRQMGHQPGAMKPGTAKPAMKCEMMAGMKDCCCKDKMAKMGDEHAGHQMSADQHQNHK